jgi:hypothetical protein
MTTPATPAAPEPAAPATPATPAEDVPPWGEDFDAEKAWNLVKGLRADKEKLAKRPTLDAEAKQKLAEYDALVEARKTDLDKANESVTRWQTDAEKWRTAAVSTTVRALAATDFADPDDAVRNVDVAQYLGADGVIDEKAIAKDLADLLEAKPHYRRADGTPAGPRVPAPNRSQGSGVNGKSAPDPAQEFAAILQGQLK